MKQFISTFSLLAGILLGTIFPEMALFAQKSSPEHLFYPEEYQEKNRTIGDVLGVNDNTQVTHASYEIPESFQRNNDLTPVSSSASVRPASYQTPTPQTPTPGVPTYNTRRQHPSTRPISTSQPETGLRESSTFSHVGSSAAPMTRITDIPVAPASELSAVNDHEKRLNSTPAQENRSVTIPEGNPLVPSSGLIALTETVSNQNGAYQQITIIDPQTKAMSVYHVDLATGQIELRSTRKIEWDLQLIYLNSKKPLPPEVQRVVEQPGRK